MKQTLMAVAALSAVSTAAIAEDFPPLQRGPVLEEAIPLANPVIKLVRGARIRFAPRQTTGLHRHPISVAGVVTAGSFIFKKEGEAEKIIKTGDPFLRAGGCHHRAVRQCIQYRTCGDRRLLSHRFKGPGAD